MDKKNLDEFTKETLNKTNYILEDTLLDSEVTIDEVRNYNYNDLAKNSPKTTMSKLPWLIAIFLIIIIAVFFVISFLNGNPQTLFTNTIDKFFSSITDNISENNYEVSKGNVKANFDIKSSEKSEMFSEISKVTFDIDYVLDSSNSQSFIKLNSKYVNDDLVNFNIYASKNDVYFYSKDLYDKYLKIKNNSEFRIISFNDLKAILNGLNQAFDKVATSEKIYGKKTNLDLGTKSIKTYESKLIVNSKNYKRVSETFINTLKSNNEFVSALAKALNTSNSNVKKDLEKSLPSLKKFFKENENLEIKLYNDRKTKDFIKGEISGKLGLFTLLKKDNKFDFKLLNNNSNRTINGSLLVDVNKAKTEYSFEVNFKDETLGKVNNSGDIELLFTNHKASSFKRVKVNDAVNFDDLNELQKLEIYAKLFSNPNLSKFINYIK